VTFSWPIDRATFPALPELTDPTTPEYDAAAAQQAAAAQLAVEVMWALSGRQYGLQDVTVRPCRDDRNLWEGRRFYEGYFDSAYDGFYDVSWGYDLFFWGSGDGYVSSACGCSGGGCRLSGPRAVHLPGPVHAVTTVTIAEAALDPSEWTLENNVLYRKDHMWPRQDLGRPMGEVNTWSVDYQLGLQVPVGVDRLTGILAKEFLNAMDSEAKCRLPRTVTAASRNGVSYRVYDPAILYANGKTGLPEVDIWLAAINPHHLIAAPTVV
jgi:hypothetical protein